MNTLISKEFRQYLEKEDMYDAFLGLNLWVWGIRFLFNSFGFIFGELGMWSLRALVPMIIYNIVVCVIFLKPYRTQAK